MKLQADLHCKRKKKKINELEDMVIGNLQNEIEREERCFKNKK